MIEQNNSPADQATAVPETTDDTDALMAKELDAKANKLWEQGARQVLGDAEFERLYPATTDQKSESGEGGTEDQSEGGKNSSYQS
jgi:hypothetical protein